MKQNLKEFIGYHIGATDGEIGKVTDFLFDKTSWTIRYVVVETGNWLSGRKVLLSTQALQGTDPDNKIFKVNLTIDQIKHSPDIDPDNPVSRQQEFELHQHYPWTGYWNHDMWPGGIGTIGMMAPAIAEPLEDAVHNAMQDDGGQQQDTGTQKERNLYGTDNVEDYTIEATDGDIGEVTGFIIDDSSWKIESLIVDTGKWLPGKKVILSPQQVIALDWLTSYAKVDVSKDAVKNLPEYHADAPDIDSHKTTLSNYNNEVADH